VLNLLFRCKAIYVNLVIQANFSTTFQHGKISGLKNIVPLL